MMPVALISANYAPLSFMAAPPPPQPAVIANSNVIRVDFVQKARTGEVIEAKGNAASAVVPEWHQIATKRLAGLRRLADGWDGPGSVSIHEDALIRADGLLQLAFDGVQCPAPPVAVPCGDGSLQLEWWLTDTRFELSIAPDGSLEAWAMARDTDQEVEGAGKEALNLLFRWAGRLTADKLTRSA